MRHDTNESSCTETWEVASIALHEIDPAQLRNSSTELFLGCGCFELVKIQYFRVIKVAVKEMLPAFHLESVIMHTMSCM